MTEELNIVLHIEDEPYLVIESNINLGVPDHKLEADVWQLPNEDDKKKFPYITNKCLKHFRGRTALTDAVLYLSELMGEPVAHRLRRSG